MVVILMGLDKDQAETFSIVLASAGIDCHLRSGEQGWELWTESLKQEEALAVIDQYIAENRDKPVDRGFAIVEYGRTFSGLWGALILLACQLAVWHSGMGDAYVAAYGASAEKILKGDWYRSATALLLHADVLHLAGNILGIALFATAVCSVAGWGVGWLMILLSGIAGNLVNALFFQSAHWSIGASTAVFGAVGILSAVQFVRKIREAGQRWKAFLPFGGGLALLGLLGSARHADLTAHLFGFSAGILLGAAYCSFFKRAPGRRGQTAALLLVAGVMTAAWLRAFGP